MAHFYGGVHGSRGPATRLGTKNSGIEVFAQGWDTGVRVYLEHVNGKDRVTVYRTAGSNGHSSDELLAEWSEEE